MKTHTNPLEPELYYHIYNRGINSCTLFLKEKHYQKFLTKYAFHIEKIAKTYAYCLLRNHFHLLIQIKSEVEIRNQFPFLNHRSIEQIVSSQFAHLFNGYAQHFNLDTNRTGKLFELPFLRKPVHSSNYFSRLIYYIHLNPQTHGIVKDFRDYPHSSFWSFLSEAQTKLAREEVLKWFGNKNEYIKFHLSPQQLQKIEPLIIEID